MMMAIRVFIKENTEKTKYIKSDIDDQYYQVRDLEDSYKSANVLARLKEIILDFSKYLMSKREENQEFKKHIEQLNDRIENVVISETGEEGEYTSYSVNKGEEIVFCLRSKENYNEIHNFNLIMYVALHEIAHVACPEYGHTDLFKKIFAFFIKQAIEKGIYESVNFKKLPTEYCGITISDSII
jgi:predicted metal-dependent hydrolase